MDWKTFRALETFSILYDIQIDEEAYDEGLCNVKVRAPGLMAPSFDQVMLQPEKRPWERKRFDLTPLEAFADIPLEVVLGGAGSPGSRNRSKIVRLTRDDGVSRLWRILLQAKRTRAALMREGATAADSALDQLALDLLRHTPTLPTASLLDKGKLNIPALQCGLLRVLMFLEASACYRGFHSIASAEDAVDSIQSLLIGLGEHKKGQSPYELLALYDKAQGELHVRSHDKAGESFRKVAECTGCWQDGIPKDTHCFEPSQSALIEPLRWPGMESLFAAYIGRPAVLQIAEVLINMQRSGEARQVLQRMDRTEVGPYQAARRLVLEGRVANDTSDPTRQLRLDGIVGLPKNPRRLLSQVDAVNIEREKSPQRRCAPLVRRAANAGFDRTELDQSVLEWTKGLGRLATVIRQADSAADVTSAIQYLTLDLPAEQQSSSPAEVRSFFDAATDLIEDGQYRDYRVEVRGKLSEGIWDLFLATHERLNATAETSGSQVRASLVDLAAAVSADANYLYDRLAKAEVQEYTEDLWRARNAFIQGELLPLEKGDDRQRSLRDFLFRRFLCTPLGGQMSAATGDCQTCEERLCFAEGCHRQLVALSEKNPSLIVHREGQEERIWHYGDLVAKRNSCGIDARLADHRSSRTPSGWAIAVLQRWNSFTPAMAASEGGGYFVYHTPPLAAGARPSAQSIDIGVAVDPGYGFIKNFLSEGFCIDDITAVAVTHDHPDHLADFEAIHNLKVERDKALKKEESSGSRKARQSAAALRAKGRMHVIVSDGARRHLERVVETSPVVADTVVIAPSNPDGVRAASHVVPAAQGAKCIKLHAIHALHKDISLASGPMGADSIGLRLELRDTQRKCAAKVGLPSDTRWHGAISKHYRDCTVVCLHLGSISGRGRRLLDFFRPKEVSDVLLDANHLFVPGVLWFIDDLAKSAKAGEPKLVVLSEFGEELSGGIRVALAEAFDAHVPDQVRVLAGDVGLLVDPVQRSVRCSCCGEFYAWRSMRFEYELFGDSEQIFYVCPSCHSALSFDQKAAIFRRSQVPLMRMILER